MCLLKMLSVRYSQQATHVYPDHKLAILPPSTDSRSLTTFLLLPTDRAAAARPVVTFRMQTRSNVGSHLSSTFERSTFPLADGRLEDAPGELTLNGTGTTSELTTDAAAAILSIAPPTPSRREDPPQARKRTEPRFLSSFHTAVAPTDPTLFDIANYLRRVQGEKGACKSCGKVIPWARKRVLSHKTASCTSITDDERAFFFNQRRLRTTPRVSPQKRHRADDDEHVVQVQPAAHSWVDCCSVADRDRITSSLANLFYRTGIPFNIVDSGAVREFLAAVRPAYAPIKPSAKALAGSHLNHAYDNLSSKVKAWVSTAFCYSLVSDGWSNSHNMHFVNYVVIIPGKTPFFYKSVCTSGSRQTSKTIAKGIMDVIEEIGASKCVSVVTDNAANMRGAWDIIETKYPKTYANGCGAHVLNLLVKDLCSMDQFTDVVEMMTFVIRFINERQHILAFVTEKRKRMSITRKLILPAPTRWFTQFNACSRLLEAKFAVLSVIDSDAADLLKQTKCQESVARFK